MSTPIPNPPNPTPEKTPVPGGPSVQNKTANPGPYKFPKRTDPYEKEQRAIGELNRLISKDIQCALQEGPITGVAVIYVCGMTYGSSAVWFDKQDGDGDEKARTQAEINFLVNAIPNIFAMGHRSIKDLNKILSGGKITP